MLISDNRASVLDSYAARAPEPDRFRIGCFFLFEYESSQIISGGAIGDIDTLLEENGSMIVMIIGEMNRTSADLNASCDCRFMDMMAIEAMPTERRNQRRMYVEYSSDEVVGDCKQAEESGERDKINLSFSQEAEYSSAVLFDAREIARTKNFAPQASVSSSFNTATVLLTGNDQRNFCLQSAGLNLIQKVKQSGSAATDQDSQTDASVAYTWYLNGGLQIVRRCRGVVHPWIRS